MKRTLRFQKPIPGGRSYLSPAVLKEVWVEVDRLARKYRVSRSWVVATILADAFGITTQVRYYDLDTIESKKKRSAA